MRRRARARMIRLHIEQPASHACRPPSRRGRPTTPLGGATVRSPPTRRSRRTRRRPSRSRTAYPHWSMLLFWAPVIEYALAVDAEISRGGRSTGGGPRACRRARTARCDVVEVGGGHELEDERDGCVRQGTGDGRRPAHVVVPTQRLACRQGARGRACRTRVAMRALSTGIPLQPLRSRLMPANRLLGFPAPLLAEDHPQTSGLLLEAAVDHSFVGSSPSPTAR
jgi:hypothetical protein